MKMLNSILLAGFCLLAAGGGSLQADEPGVKITSVKMIWDAGDHNAFTDLLRHDGKWYCVFREGKGHVSPDGALRILTSTDGEEWTSAALVTADDADLRDAKISVAPDGRLCLCGAAAWHKPEKETHQTFLWYSSDGKNWGERIAIGDPGYWIWRIEWHQGIAYGIGYKTGKMATHATRLYKSEDGRHFQTLVASLTPADSGYVNEAGMLILPDGTFLSIVRRDNRSGETDALLGTAKAPYGNWTWKHTGVRIGGPDMIQLPDGRIIVAGRDYVTKAKTALWWLNPETGELTQIAVLPSKGDTSYPGLVYHDGELWVSYYSSRDGKTPDSASPNTSIYLARLQLPAKQ